MSLRIRRGTDAQRSGIAFDQGEIIWTTDTEKLYVGDGITQGGKNIAAQLAGTGLQWNAVDEVLETAALSFNTDQISEGSNNRYFTVQRAQDASASLFTTGTHSGITFTYDDVLHKINASVTIANETVQDAIAPLFTGGIHSGISFGYDDGNNRINATVTLPPEDIQDIVGPMLNHSVHTGISFAYDDSLGRFNAAIDSEYIQDLVGPMLNHVVHTGISFAYDDSLGLFNASIDPEYIQDQVGLMFSGAHDGIGFAYDDLTGVITANVDSQVVLDTAPQLGGDLDLNNFDIVGFGNIDYFGNFFNGSITLNQSLITSNNGVINIGAPTSPSRLEVVSDGFNMATFKTKTNGILPSSFFIDGYKTSLTTPTNFAGNDVVSVIAMRGYQPAVSDFRPTFSLYGLYDANADFTYLRPRSSLIISTGNNTDDVYSLGNRYIFDGNGSFSAPMLKTGAYGNTIERDTHAYTATPGTMIFLASDGIATAFTGNSAISSGATFDIDLSQNVYTPTLTSPGTLYTVGEIIKIDGSLLGGTDNSNDLIITVSTITGIGTSGPIDTFTVLGSGIDIFENYTNVGQSSTSGSGAGAKFLITVENDETFTVVLTTVGSGYAVAEELTFDGTLFGGTSPANDLTVSVTAIASLGGTGPISTFSFTGTAPVITQTFTGVAPSSTSNTTLILTTDANASFVGKVLSGPGIPLGTTVSSADTGVSITISDPTTLNVATTQFVVVDVGVPRFQGCTVAATGTPEDPGYVPPTWVSFN